MKAIDIEKILRSGKYPGGNHFRLCFHSTQSMRRSECGWIDFEPYDYFGIGWSFLLGATVEVIAEPGKGEERMLECRGQILAARPKWSVWCVLGSADGYGLQRGKCEKVGGAA